MNNLTRQESPPRAGTRLRSAAVASSLGGLLLSLVGTLFIWAGTEAFHCQEAVWQTSLSINLACFVLSWLVYLPFRGTDKVLGKGLVALFLFISMFWLFGFAMCYFYFLYAPLGSWTRAAALSGITAFLACRGLQACYDIRRTTGNRNGQLDKIYCENGSAITFSRAGFARLLAARRDRTPFSSAVMYAAVLLGPAAFATNRLFGPVVGEGHMIFSVTALLTLPILEWMVGTLVVIAAAMIYYPIRLQHRTGKPVLLKDW